MQDMSVTKTEMEKLTRWLGDRAELLNLSEIGRRIQLEPSAIRKAVAGLKDSKGTKARIPERCLEELRNVINELTKKPRTKQNGIR